MRVYYNHCVFSAGAVTFALVDFPAMPAPPNGEGWAGTPLGPPAAWPPGLRLLADALIALPMPACLLWGPDLLHLHNGAWATLAGPRHAEALGRPAAAGPAALWGAASFDPVRRGGALDLPSGTGAAAGHVISLRPLRETAATAGGEPRIAAILACAVRGAAQALAAAEAALTRAESALRESEARFTRAVEAAQAGTWEWDPLADVWTGSPGQEERLVGRPAGSLRNLAAVLDAVHPEDRPQVRQAVRRVLAGETDTYQAEFRTLWPDGTVRWLRSVGRATREGSVVRHLSGVSLDITAEVEARQRQALLAREVDHRAKNALAVVQSVVRLTQAEDPVRFRAAVEGRIAALARAQTLLAANRWQGADLHALLEGELSPHLGAAPRVELHGPLVSLPARAAQPMAMALHELATNAAAHGALSHPDGRVQVRWTVSGPGGALRLRWVEQGGPPLPEAPPRRGFGWRVLDGTVRHQLGGSLALDFAPDGLTCTIEMSLGDRLRAA
ncbi:HWE histidine kinase domain-containing protein [Roseomonas sp. AR75]|uniref:HWE histidine kinase domain-containing protein n=1 Tax=Roseomonas sp. AR75 TaxID=2562311 RepID=UPI0010BFAB0C|nr:HWE histidine kinase domain-containing protein [Roseomonas sp. AR75]